NIALHENELGNDGRGEHHHRQNSFAHQAPSAVTYFGTLQFFSQSTARKALCSIAQRCEFASVLFMCGCLEYIGWQLWTKSRCSGLEGEIKYLVCTSAIQFEGSIMILVPLGAFFMPMRWVVYGPMAIFSAVFFFVIRWIPGMPELDDKYLISSALVLGGALAVCIPSIYLIERARRAEFLLIIRRHLRLMEMSILSEKKRELLLMYG
ncbi:transmembrane protein, putative, partial [Bodo saltans]